MELGFRVQGFTRARRCAPEQAIQEVKDDAEKDLAAAKPALDAALSALNSITPKDITALKALKNPPDIVKRIFDCVLLLRWSPRACPSDARMAFGDP